MAKSQTIARQSAHPRGILGHLVARVMALDTASVNRRAVQALGPKPGDQILELGCGHGRALRWVADSVAPGCAVGVDPSAVMCGVAQGHNRRAIREGRVQVKRGHSGQIPEADDAFDKVFSVHTVYFWPDLDAGLREIRRVMRPGGELLLAAHSRDNRAIADKLPTSVYSLRSDDEMREALERAGFSAVRITSDPQSDVRLTHAVA
jgi:ubiquinone/menaquinone biosynthesis C-methylase UbiE